MTDRMEMEKIKHDVAKAVFEDTEYNWVDMLDHTEEADNEALKLIPFDWENYWIAFFSNRLDEMKRHS